MVIAVVPCHNEEKGIQTVLGNLLNTSTDLILVIANGCSDRTVDRVASLHSPRVKLLEFSEALGLDVPRAVGASQAYNLGAETILFVDGDMIGKLSSNFEELISSVKNNQLDLALTNCYPQEVHFSSLASNVLTFRCRLNYRLNYFKRIGAANPSHGPHAISRSLLSKIGYKPLVKPPLLLSLAKLKGLKVGIGTEIAHRFLGSRSRSIEHNLKIAETIIGDCLEALCVFEGAPPNRFYKGVFYNGYNNKRRLDLLKEFYQ